MSRDWTPQEQYNADIYFKAKYGNSLRDQQFMLVTPDGKKVSLKDDISKKLDKQYSELSFLFDLLPQTYRALSKHPKYRKEVLDRIENHLKELENSNNGQNNDTVWLWYTGRLDNCFYYRDCNNGLFMNYIIEEVKKLIK